MEDTGSNIIGPIMVEPDISRPNGVTKSGGRIPRPPYHSPFSLRWCLRSLLRHLPHERSHSSSSSFFFDIQPRQGLCPPPGSQTWRQRSRCLARFVAVCIPPQISHSLLSPTNPTLSLTSSL